VNSTLSRGIDNCVRAAIATKRNDGDSKNNKNNKDKLLPRSAHKIYKLLGGLYNSLYKVSAYGILFD
jgi:hypothetical protein